MLEVFQNEEFGMVRAIEEGDKVLFCAADVAKALGYSNQRDAVGRHCRGVVKRDMGGTDRNKGRWNACRADGRNVFYPGG